MYVVGKTRTLAYIHRLYLTIQMNGRHPSLQGTLFQLTAILVSGDRGRKTNAWWASSGGGDSTRCRMKDVSEAGKHGIVQQIQTCLIFADTIIQNTPWALFSHHRDIARNSNWSEITNTPYAMLLCAAYTQQ